MFFKIFPKHGNNFISIIFLIFKFTESNIITNNIFQLIVISIFFSSNERAVGFEAGQFISIGVGVEFENNDYLRNLGAIHVKKYSKINR